MGRRERSAVCYMRRYTMSLHFHVITLRTLGAGQSGNRDLQRGEEADLAMELDSQADPLQRTPLHIALLKPERAPGKEAREREGLPRSCLSTSDVMPDENTHISCIHIPTQHKQTCCTDTHVRSIFWRENFLVFENRERKTRSTPAVRSTPAPALGCIFV